jgi:hypothetical protein
MNTRYLPLLTVTVMLTCTAGPARGALTEHTWNTPGDLTFDDETFLEWLDWTVTTDLSYDDVSAQLGPGGAYAGFRYATGDEVLSLFDHAGIPPYPQSYPSDVPQVLALMDLLGRTAEAAYVIQSIAVIDDVNIGIPGTHWSSHLRVNYTDPGEVYAKDHSINYYDYYHQSGSGHALVRMIPEPAGIVIWSTMGLAALGYGVCRRRKK